MPILGRASVQITGAHNTIDPLEVRCLYKKSMEIVKNTVIVEESNDPPSAPITKPSGELINQLIEDSVPPAIKPEPVDKSRARPVKVERDANNNNKPEQPNNSNNATEKPVNEIDLGRAAQPGTDKPVSTSTQPDPQTSTTTTEVQTARPEGLQGKQSSSSRIGLLPAIKGSFKERRVRYLNRLRNAKSELAEVWKYINTSFTSHTDTSMPGILKPFPHSCPGGGLRLSPARRGRPPQITRPVTLRLSLLAAGRWPRELKLVRPLPWAAAETLAALWSICYFFTSRMSGHTPVLRL